MAEYIEKVWAEMTRELLEDAEALYEKRMHGEKGLTIREENRLDDILTIDLPYLAKALAEAVRPCSSCGYLMRSPELIATCGDCREYGPPEWIWKYGPPQKVARVGHVGKCGLR